MIEKTMRNQLPLVLKDMRVNRLSGILISSRTKMRVEQPKIKSLSSLETMTWSKRLASELTTQTCLA